MAGTQEQKSFLETSEWQAMLCDLKSRQYTQEFAEHVLFILDTWEEKISVQDLDTPEKVIDFLMRVHGLPQEQAVQYLCKLRNTY